MTAPDQQARLRQFWDDDAEVYDRSPSHSASDPVEAAAWRAVLARHLPSPGARVLDAGAGTGAISLLLAELGYRVTALDLSPRMLGKASEKAQARGLHIETVTGPASDPPQGPFDAVVERHLLWTTPDPVKVLSAWRRACPEGRVILYEQLRGSDVLTRAREAGARIARGALRVPADHHGEYDPDLLAALPLAGARSPIPFLRALEEAGWRRFKIERLRDVEWARRLAAGWILGPLEAVPRFAVLAE